MRKLVIGDIHGNLRGLLQVLERANYDPSSDLLISIGDIVDGWSQSAECVEFLIKDVPNKILIRGNHDIWCHNWLELGQVNIVWLQNGGKVTLSSYVASGLLTEKSHLDLFKSQLNHYVDEENRLFVHGGFNRWIPFDDQVKEINTPWRLYADCQWDRSLWQAAKSYEATSRGDDSIGPFWGLHPEDHQFSEIFIGHTADSDKNGHPLICGGVHNVDTGGGWDGKLTIMNIDTKEFWQSDPSPELYPDELGRT